MCLFQSMRLKPRCTKKSVSIGNIDQEKVLKITCYTADAVELFVLLIN